MRGVAGQQLEFQIDAVDLERDYAMLAAWWKEHGWPVIPKSSLPPEGVLIRNEVGKPISAGFLYLSKADICWMEWIVSNPNARLRERALSLPLLVEELCFLAKEKGCRIVFVALKNAGLKAIVKAQGFAIGDLGSDHFIKEL